MRLRHIVVACAFALACGMPGLASAEPPILENTNMPGNDFRDFELAQGAGTCQETCMKDAHCEAWTWVRAGLQGQKPHCWLKNKVPRAVADQCCKSGTRAQRID